MDSNLENIIDKIDNEIIDTKDELSDSISITDEFNRRITIVEGSIGQLTELLENEENPEVINELKQHLTRLNEQINTFNNTLLSAEENINKMEKRIKDLKHTKAFAKLTTLETFHAKNPPQTSQALKMSEIVGNIAEYGGRKSKKRNTRRHKTRKQRKSRK